MIRKLFLLIILFILFSGFAYSEKQINKKAVLIIAPFNFQDNEYFITKDELIRSGIKIYTASLNPEKAVSQSGRTVKPDIGINMIRPGDFDAIVFIGGPGVTVYFENPIIKNLAIDFYKNRKITAAICLAPVILANSGILKDKNATVWDNPQKEFSSVLIKHGANYTQKPVVIDGIIITADGPLSSSIFSRAIVRELLK